MSFFKEICASCGTEYEADSECMPKHCAMYCSQGCAETGGWKE